MTTCSCTNCGCEATATSVDLVVAMGWRVLGAVTDESKSLAVCAACWRLPAARLEAIRGLPPSDDASATAVPSPTQAAMDGVPAALVTGTVVRP